MSWFLFELEIWIASRRIEQYHKWYDLYFRDRFDNWPCRDCDVPEGMWW
jgi:hypothetical protein